MSTTMRQDASPVLFVAFDTETTGLSPVGDRVVEIAALAFRGDGSEVARFEHLVNPGIPIPPLLTTIHGITDEMVAGKPSMEEVLPEFVRFVGSSVLVAHNAPYDVSMLLVPLVRLSRISGQAGLRPPGNLVLDTCTLARAVFPGAPNYRLGTVADLLGIARGRAHRAMSDVLTCKGVFLRILSQCPPETTLDDLVRMNGSELRLGVSETMLPAALSDRRRLTLLLEAMRSVSPVMIAYQGGSKGSGPRLVTPITLMAQAGATFLVAHCHLDGGLKNFRMDRIAAVYPLPAS